MGSEGGYFRRQWPGGFLCASPWILGFVVFGGVAMAGYLLSRPELETLYTGLTAQDVSRIGAALKEAGLDTLPGTAAEILDDDVRFVLSRNKLRTDQWREVITTAHRCGIRTTSTLMYGHIEKDEDIIEHLDQIRTLQAEAPGFTAFAMASYAASVTSKAFLIWAISQGLFR